MSKKTAVEWLIEKISEKQPNGFYVIDTLEDVAKTFEQAKAMEKEQMIDIGTHCFARGHKGFQPIESDAEPTAEEYYNETYGGEE